MSGRDDLARRAVTEALRFRNRHGRGALDAVCPIDLAHENGVDVRLEPIPSLEGMYTPDGPTIVLGSLRPRGRRAYSCAHELGHHVFGHGLRVDELLEGQAQRAPKDDAEFVADRFAAALLMPKLAVLHAFTTRGWHIEVCEPEQVFVIAGLFGVGYTTLIGYLEGTLRAISCGLAHQLRKVTPRALRERILGIDAAGLVVVDEHWAGRPADLEVGDYLIVPPGTSPCGSALQRVHNDRVQAVMPGVASLRRGTWTVEVRVARAGYHGLANYRHLEDVDDES